MSKPIKNLTGLKFGRLTVLNKRIESKKNILWLCKCDCGTEKFIRLSHLPNGHSKSCGCWHLEIVKKIRHGMSNTRTFISWASMLSRCKNKNIPRYKDYGGRGIKVCKRWLKFENFYKDMKERPEGLSIDRKDNNKGYYKSNCRWATAKEQQNNKRKRRKK